MHPVDACYWSTSSGARAHVIAGSIHRSLLKEEKLEERNTKASYFSN